MMLDPNVRIQLQDCFGSEWRSCILGWHGVPNTTEESAMCMLKEGVVPTSPEGMVMTVHTLEEGTMQTTDPATSLYISVEYFIFLFIQIV